MSDGMSEHTTRTSMAHRPLRVHFDGSAFLQHRRSGISRYVAELIGAYDADPALGVQPVTPYRYITNVHARSTDRGFRSLPLPGRLRTPVLGRLNRRRARALGPVDLTHYPLYDAALLDAARSGVSVTTVYDFTWEVFPELFGDVTRDLGVKREFLDACDVLVCISEATRRDLHRFHPELDKPVLVTPLAVADAFRTAVDRPVKGLPERYLLHVGNRHRHKNVDLVHRAFRELAATDPDLHLVLCGQALPEEAALIAEIGVPERTHVVRLSDADLPSAYRRAQAFVFPSRYEGFGLPLLEAMAAGCPSLISTTPALTEVGGEDVDAVDPDDVDGAVAALQRLLGDAAHTAARREAGRRRAGEFTWRRTAELTAAAYDRAARSAQ
jgi:glycosyltransferase involved in cell wall biosynthesis